MSLKRCPAWLALLGLVALVAPSGCCNWCEKHCPACHQPTAAAYPPPTCCVPCQPQAVAPVNYQAPPQQSWTQPMPMTCTCTPNR